MPKDDLNYKFTENGIVYDFYDVFVPAEYFREPALWVWGQGGFGAVGDNTTITRNTPVTTFAGGTNWKQVSVGYFSMAAIKTDGSLWTWGRNQFSVLGTNDATQRNTPVTTLTGGTNWKQISVGLNRMAAIKTDGSLWTWGQGGSALGTNDTITRSTPVTTFAGGNTWKSVEFGSVHVAAIKTDGTLWTWGQNSSGQLGVNDITTRSIPVTTLLGGNNWKQVSCGDGGHTAAIKSDGSLWTWGWNINGALGINDTTSRNTPVTTLLGGNNWKQVSCGSKCTLAIKTDGTLWTWGSNSNGKLGTNDTITRSTPVTTFVGGNDWKQVSVGEAASAIKTDGSLWTWGYNGDGNLGIGDGEARSIPVTTLLGGNNWKQVSFVYTNSAAIKYSPDP